jgi:hypothetical protein
MNTIFREATSGLVRMQAPENTGTSQFGSIQAARIRL